MFLASKFCSQLSSPAFSGRDVSSRKFVRKGENPTQMKQISAIAPRSYSSLAASKTQLTNLGSAIKLPLRSSVSLLQAGLGSSSSTLFQQQKRNFWKSKEQKLRTELNFRPNDVGTYIQLLQELNRKKKYSEVKALVEGGRHPLNEQQVIAEYMKALAYTPSGLDGVDFVKLLQASGLPQAAYAMPHVQPHPMMPYGNVFMNPATATMAGAPTTMAGAPVPPPQPQQQQQQSYQYQVPPIVPPFGPQWNWNQTASGQPLQVKIYSSKTETTMRILGTLLTLGFLGAILYLMLTTNGQEEKKNSSNFPISPAHSQVKSINTRFADVKGCDEVKQELVEVVEYLKNPSKFTQLGAKLPKGLLLSGPPGTGKTLLARAIAGEAGVNFLYCSGSSFDELFVGVGPRRVRALFEDAKAQSPCIIFIDEIDAVGVKRSKFSMSYSKESTLNQLLTEMDGFSQTSGIIVIGATNFPEALDSALTRPGRFDKLIHVPLPDLKGRKDIIDLYLKKTVPGPDVDSKVLARGTPGFSGAELANLINIAAIKATIQNKSAIDMRVLEEAKDDVLMGIKRTFEQTEEDRKLTAYHEGGHALVALHTEGARPLHKATIISRGGALGVTVQLPERDEVSVSRKQMLARLAITMGGRAAEELVFGEEEVTSGASSDFKSATSLATQMVAHWGMSDKVGKVYHSTTNEQGPLVSQEEVKVINSEIKDLIEERYRYARNILLEHEDELHRIADALLKYETLSGEEIKLAAQGRLKKEI